MAAYYKVDVSLSTNSVTVGMPSPQEVIVTLPLVGPAGATGATGATGANGQGVPVGGSALQVLRKVSSTDYDTEWATGGGDIDLSSPDPIGDVMPNTGSFTTLSATGTATLPHIHGSLAGNLYIHVKNTSGGQLTRGTPVYIVGNVGSTDRVEVAAADFDDATKMPAVGLLEQTLANNGSGDAIILGELDEANTNAYTINTELFVGNNGALTSTRPTTGQVQSVGVVARVNSNTGVIVVNMQGQRSPNETFAAASHTHAASAITSGVLDNDRINFAAPAAIGNTTPAAANFTTIRVDPKTGSVGSLVVGSTTGSENNSIVLDSTGIKITAAGGVYVATIARPSSTADRSYQLPDASGTLALTSRIPYAVFTATDNQPTATSFARLDTRNSIAVLDFTDTSTESAVFVGILPEAASLGSGLIVSLRWMATTATSGDVRWSVAWEKSNTDLDSDSYDTATASNATTNGTSGIVTVTNITCTNIDSLAAGDLFRLRVQRIGGDGADTMTLDAELVAVEVRSAA